jgi:hypothetical protein
MGERTKRQHIVPRFYLRHFTQADGELWTHDCVSGSARKSTPEKTAYETNIYTPPGEHGVAWQLIVRMRLFRRDLAFKWGLPHFVWLTNR